MLTAAKSYLANSQRRQKRYASNDAELLLSRCQPIQAPDLYSFTLACSDVWVEAAQIAEGRLLRAIYRGGKTHGSGLSDWAIWSVVEAAAAELGIEQIEFLLGHSSIQTTERYLGSSQDLERAVNDDLGLE